jgi:predicted outer membrane protein
MTRMGFLSIALTAFVAIGCNRSSTATNGSIGTTGNTDRNEVKAADKASVNDLIIANMAEVELGKLAVERGASSEVKKFGQMMIDDHTKAGDKLKSVASAQNIPVPTDLDDKHRDLRDKLAKLSGSAFDREYMAAMVEGHEGVADKLESRIDSAKLAEKSDNVVTMAVNEWAAEAYPVVQKHLEAAKVLDEALKR